MGKLKKKHKFPFRYLFLLLLIIGFTLFRIYYTPRSAERAPDPITPVKVTTPEYGSIEKTLRLSGHIEAKNTITVMPKISGILERLFADEGDKVSQGQIIGRVESEQYRLTLNQAKASYDTAKSTYERVERLFQANSTSKQNYEETKARFESAESQYELAKIQYRDTQVTAPVEGTVLVKHTSQGTLVSPQVPLITIGDLDQLVIKSSIPEPYYQQFRGRENNMDITLQIPALDGKSFSGSLSALSPFISAESRSFTATITIHEDSNWEPNYLRPGMFTRIIFTLDKKSGIYSLPFAALVESQYLWYVKHDKNRDHNNVFTARKIEFRPEFYNNSTFVIPDEYKDHKFIMAGHHFLQESQQVRLEVVE